MKRAVPGRVAAVASRGLRAGRRFAAGGRDGLVGAGREGPRRPQRQLPPLPRPGRHGRGRHELHPRPRQARRPQEDRPRPTRSVAAVQAPLHRQDAARRRNAAPLRGRRRRRQAVDRARRPAAGRDRPPADPHRRRGLSSHSRRPRPAGAHAARRFLRYFSLAPIANAGAGDDELQTYRNALAKLLNSLSWHPAHHPADADRRRPHSSCASTCATTSGTPSSGTASWPTIPTASSTTRPPPAPSSSARPRASPASGPTGSSPAPRWRRSTTICCKSRPICRNWSGSCASMWRRTCSRSAWRGPASSAPASRATTASSSGTTP